MFSAPVEAGPKRKTTAAASGRRVLQLAVALPQPVDSDLSSGNSALVLQRAEALVHCNSGVHRAPQTCAALVAVLLNLHTHRQIDGGKTQDGGSIHGGEMKEININQIKNNSTLSSRCSPPWTA